MADTIKNPDLGRIWLISSLSPTRRAVIESDHLMLLTAGGYKDTIRRILFNRIERICVYTGTGPTAGFWGALLLLVVDVGVFLLAVATKPPAGVILVLVILLGWPVPILIYRMIYSALNPIHQIYIVRQGRTHIIKTTLPRRKFAEFHAQLCRNIRDYQSRFTTVESAAIEDASVSPAPPEETPAPPATGQPSAAPSTPQQAPDVSP